MPSIDIIPDASDADIANWMAIRLAVALATHTGAINITIPGGSTPFPILRQLIANHLDWRRIVVWPGDDRIVDENHPASNVGRIRALLEPEGAQIVPLAMGSRPPRFTLAWLGMGEDGHIASLFPNTDPQVDDGEPVRRLTPVPLPPEAPFDRITLTIPTLLNSAELMFVIRGAAKHRLFATAAADENDLPVARLLRHAQQPVTCFT